MRGTSCNVPDVGFKVAPNLSSPLDTVREGETERGREREREREAIWVKICV